MTNSDEYSGYHHRILDVDLSRDKTTKRPVDPEWARRWVGGRGWGAKLFHEIFHEEMDPLGPENPLIIAPGPLSGLYVPAGGKTSFVSLSPQTGLYGDSNMGGSFGVEIRQAGYDALVIRGRAQELSYLWIDDGNVEIRSAKQYRGMGNLQTERSLKDDLWDEEIRVATIGPAGENLVRFACINGDWSRNAGRTGMGAVMGSKNLKAIAVRGSKDLPVHDVDELTRLSDQAFQDLRDHDLLDYWQEQGLMSVVDYANEAGILPVRNFQDGRFQGAERVNGTVMEEDYKIGNTACFGCPLACGNICVVKKGKYAGTVTEGPEYETAAMFGPNLDIDSFPAILRANEQCDELGVDTITTGAIVGALMEAHERGILSRDDLGGLEPRWGDDEVAMELVRLIAYREGIGDTLAGAAPQITKKWPEMQEVLSHVKGLEQSAYDARAAPTMALAYATSDIGAHHARAWTVAKELEMGSDWGAEERVGLVIHHQTIRPLFDMLGVCRLPWIELGFRETFYADAYTAVTGEEVTLDDLFERSRQVYDLTRSISVRLGVTRADDYPPPRVFNDPMESGPHAGKTLDPDEYEELLGLYYEKRGWTPEGIPPEDQE